MCIKQRCHRPYQTLLIDPFTFPTETHQATSRYFQPTSKKLLPKLTHWIKIYLLFLAGDMEYIKTGQRVSEYGTDKLVRLEKQRTKMCLLTILFKANPRKNSYDLIHQKYLYLPQPRNIISEILARALHSNRKSAIMTQTERMHLI